MKTKQIEYSYATSTNAAQFGFGKVGCYVVEECNGIKPPKALKGFKTFEEALEYANKLPLEWNHCMACWSLKLTKP